MRTLRNIFAGICFILSVFFLAFTIYAFAVPDAGGKTLGVSFTLIFFLLGYFLKVQSKYSADIKEKNEELGIIASSLLHHVEGLPIAEKTQCIVSITPEMLIIEGGGTDFNISTIQIRAAEVKTDTEIANIIHSSAAKGIAGGLLFGPIGLVVGSRAKSKEKKTNTYFLIINYTNSAGEIAAIMFDGGNSPFSVQKIASKLKPLIANNPKQTVQL